MTLESQTKLRPKPKKRMKPSRQHRETTCSIAPQEAEQNSIMGKLDEGLDDFFSKKVIKLSFRFPSVKGPSSNTQDATDKKRESRRSGFFNLIKSRTSRSEKSHGAASITPPHPASAITALASSSAVTPVTEETTPTSPTPSAKPPEVMVEPHVELHKAQSLEQADSEVEAPATVVEEEKTRDEKNNLEKKESLEKREDVEKKEKVEKKDHPHIPRHIGVPVMGMDLMAEMKARQERMAVKKLHSEASSLQEKVDGDKGKSDVHSAPPAHTEESRPEPAVRSKPANVIVKPPPPQATKPSLGLHTSGPTSPVSPKPSGAHIHDDSAGASAGGSSTKCPLPAPRLKRVSSEQERERESVSSVPAGPLPPLEFAFHGEGGDAFEAPGAGSEPGAGGRQWSSLKNSASAPTAREEDRERTKSLPTYVTPPSLADTDLSPAEEEFPPPAEDESSDDSPSV
ncbi:hypothetical protein Q5P01_018788 [Channa striata]|uniref:CARMIL C-terminal domain-containing protein n=1 Tax=Channa striata TaxID=64152 RepID=A0AA88SA89_CHASR|nr:hypothetical protein Q5P01_018788 [Channa striata]